MNMDLLIPIASLVVGLLLGSLVLWIICKQKVSTLEDKVELNIVSYENIIESLRTQNQKLEEDKKLQEKVFEDKKAILEDKFKIQLNSLSNEFSIKEENLIEKIELLESSREKQKLEFENLANRLFEENSKKSSTNLNQMLSPFKEQLASFGKRVDDIYNEETKQRITLLTEIKNLKDLNNQISQDAVNLTKALKGENKTQGDWGELILSKILEQTGLREGIEYSTQGSYTSIDGKRLRPDVIVHLPSKKDIVIDSKVSLTAYLKYTEAKNDEERIEATKELVKSLYAHIKGLGAKSYENIEDVKSLDFVLMFIPIEGAFMLAASQDNNLFKIAFENNIMLVSPSTLFATLRTVENIWRYEHQNENALEIAKKGGFLYDKFALFVKDLEAIGLNISRTQEAYDNAMNKLTTGSGNLLKRSNDLLELGVKAKKKIDSQKLLGE